MNTGWSSPSPREGYHLPASVCQGFASRLRLDGAFLAQAPKGMFCRSSELEKMTFRYLYRSTNKRERADKKAEGRCLTLGGIRCRTKFIRPAPRPSGAVWGPGVQPLEESRGTCMCPGGLYRSTIKRERTDKIAGGRCLTPGGIRYLTIHKKLPLTAQSAVSPGVQGVHPLVSWRSWRLRCRQCGRRQRCQKRRCRPDGWRRGHHR